MMPGVGDYNINSLLTNSFDSSDSLATTSRYGDPGSISNAMKSNASYYQNSRSKLPLQSTFRLTGQVDPVHKGKNIAPGPG